MLNEGSPLFHIPHSSLNTRSGHALSGVRLASRGLDGRFCRVRGVRNRSGCLIPHSALLIPHLRKSDDQIEMPEGFESAETARVFGVGIEVATRIFGDAVARDANPDMAVAAASVRFVKQIAGARAIGKRDAPTCGFETGAGEGGAGRKASVETRAIATLNDFTGELFAVTGLGFIANRRDRADGFVFERGHGC